MKIGFIPDRDPPLVRIFSFTPDEAETLRDAVLRLEEGTAETVVVHDLPGVESVGGCRLTFKTGRRDIGIRLPKGGRDFECILTPVWWGNVTGLMEPFCQPGHDYGYQWLYEGNEVDLLISVDGGW